MHQGSSKFKHAQSCSGKRMGNSNGNTIKRRSVLCMRKKNTPRLGEFRDWPKAITARSQYPACCPSTAAQYRCIHNVNDTCICTLSHLHYLLFRLQCALSQRSMCPMPTMGRSKQSLKYDRVTRVLSCVLSSFHIMTPWYTARRIADSALGQMSVDHARR